MSRPRGLPHSIRHTGIECTFLPEVYMYTTLARTHTHGHETTSLRSVMSGAVARTTESNSAMTFEHSGMPSYAPGDSALESRGADRLRTAKLSQNSSSEVWAPTDCPTQVLPAELSDSNLPSGKCSESEESIEGTAKQGTSNKGETTDLMVSSRKRRRPELPNIPQSASVLQIYLRRSIPRSRPYRWRLMMRLLLSMPCHQGRIR